MSITRSSPVQVAAFTTTFSQAPKLVSTSWSKVSVGPSHVLAIKSNNTLWAWGINTNGQVGDSTTISRSSPVQIGNPSYTWNDISAGINYSVGIRGDGLLFAWGINTQGILGDLNVAIGAARSSPNQIGTSSWTQVTAGGTHVVAIRSDRSLWAWGLNNVGQLGNGDYYSRSSPVQVSSSSWSIISAGNTHTTAITTNGKLFTWGDNTAGTLGYTTPVQPYYSWTTVAGNTDYTIAIRNDGLLFAWGTNNFGQLGDNTTINRSSPVQIGTSSWSIVSANAPTGGGPVLAIRSDGTLWGWGYNATGVLGINDVANRSSPVQVSGGGSWSSVASSRSHTLAVKSTDGLLYAWGLNSSGQLGTNNLISCSSPVQVSGLISSYLLTFNSATAVDNSGNNNALTVGAGTPTIGNSIIPFSGTFSAFFGFDTYYNVSTPALGTQFTIDFWVYITQANNSNWYWTFTGGGFPMIYTIGNGTSTTSIGKVNAGGSGNFSGAVSLANNTWAHIAFTRNSVNLMTIWLNGASVATLSDGTSYTGSGLNVGYVRGGNSGSGMLGYMSNFRIINNYTAYTAAFTRPTTASPAIISIYGTFTPANRVTAISAGDTSSYVIKNDNKLFTWGAGTDGRLGLTDTVNRSSPVQIGSNSWTSVFAYGATWAHAINSNNKLFAWGLGTTGQLGYNDIVSRSSPVQISTGNFSTLGAYGTTPNTLAIQTDGSLWAWGSKTNLLLGEFSNASYTYSWSQVSAGPSHTAAIRSDGRLYTWGLNSSGQIGNGTTTNTSSPTFITVSLGGPGEFWNRVTVNGLRTIAALNDGTLWTWGNNQGYLLGDGTSINRSTPTQIGIKAGAAFPFNGSNQFLSATANAAVNFATGDFTIEFWAYPTVNNRQDWIDMDNGTGRLLIYYDGANIVYYAFAAARITGSAMLLNRWQHIAVSRASGSTRLFINGVQSGGTFADTLNFPTQPLTIGKDSAGSTYVTGFMAGIRILKGVGLYTSNFLTPTSPPSLIAGSTSLLLTSALTDSSGTLTITNNNRVGLTTTFTPFFDTTSFAQLTSGSSHSLVTDSLGKLYSWGDNTYQQLGYIATYSTLFNGSTNYVTLPSNQSAFTFGTGDFTVEMWVYITSLAAIRTLYDTVNGADATGTGRFAIQVTTGGVIQLFTLAGTIVTSGGALTTNIWYHISASRVSASLILFVNGVQVGTTVTDNNNYVVGTVSRPVIGINGYDLSTSPMLGYISNVRVIKGQGLYTATFTPSTTPLTNTTVGSTGAGAAISLTGTVSLLALQNNTFIDNSGNNFTLTTNGSITNEQTVNPFGHVTYPVQVGTSSWSQVSSYGNHSLAIDVNNKLYSWGDNTLGQVGVSASPYYWISVYASKYTSHFAKRHDGTLWSWGINANGQLGTSNTVNRSSPVQIGTSSWSMVAAGASHVLAISGDGTLWSWGSNINGQLGEFTTTAVGGNRSSPVQVGTSSWIYVASDGTTSFAIDTVGRLFAWGQNTAYGALGLGDTINRSSPVQVGASSWISVATGAYSSVNLTIAVRSDGALFAWGYNGNGQLAQNDIIHRSSPVQVGPGTSWNVVGGTAQGAVFAIRNDYTLWGWGLEGGYGFLAQSTININRSSPVQIGTGYNFTQVSVQEGSMFALRNDGALIAWGYNANGELGQGDTINRSSPVQVGTSSWTAIAAGPGMLGITYANTALPNLYAWGQGLFNGLSFARSSPVQINSMTLVQQISSPTQIGTDSWTSISAGLSNSFAIRSDYKLFSWGDNSQLQSGYITPATVLSTSNKTNNDAQSFIRSSDNALIIWGLNDAGQLGDNTTINRSSPVQLGLGFGYSQFKKIARAKVTNLGYTLGVRIDGTLWSWGNNANGQLGIGLTTNRSSPVQIGTLTDWSDVAAGRGHALAIKSDGSLWGWGNNANGQLGENTTVNRSSPVQIGTSSWIAVSAGFNFSTAIRIDGGLFTWGLNDYGQLASGLTTPRSNPVQVGASSWVSISSGDSHSVALRTDRTLYGWGLNVFGQLGDGSAISRSSPVQVNTGLVTSWNFVSAGTQHTSAIDATNNLPYGWGLNNNGQIGDNTLVSKSSPVQVSLLGASNFSYQFNGSTQYLTIPSNTVFAFGTNNFTVECWVYLSVAPTSGEYSILDCASPGQFGFSITSTTIKATVTTLTTHTFTQTLTASVWYHIAFCRVSTTLTCYVNGISIGTNTVSYSFTSPNTLNIGRNAGTNGSFYNGYLSNLRIVKGTALYTAGFYPSTGALTTTSQGATASQVSLLTAQSATIVDNSTNIFTISNAGTVTVSGTNPFGPYYSGSFNGTNQYLRISNSLSASYDPATSDFTMEAWVHPTSIAGSCVVMSRWSSNGTNGWIFFWSRGGNGLPRFETTATFGNLNLNSTVAITLNTWSHLAVVRSSSTLTIYMNGVSVASTTISGTASCTSDLLIGAHDNGVQTGGAGYISNVRMVVGVAVYTGSFSRPTNNLLTTQFSGTNINSTTSSQTKLLILQSATIVDNSINALSITNTGGVPITTAFAPFSASTAGVNTTWDSIQAGVTSTMGTSNNTLFTWGAGSNGQLGDNTITAKSAPTTTGVASIWSVAERLLNSPVQVGTIKSWSIVAAGGAHTIATATDNTVWSWGQNNVGQFGDSTTVGKSSPTQIAGNTSSYTFITAGVSNTFAIRTTTNLLFVWGFNTIGQLGLTDIVNRSSPVQVASATMLSPLIPIRLNTVSGSSYTVVQAGSAASVIDSIGRLFTWGTNTAGQVANNTVVSRSSPVQVGGLTGLTYINSPIQVGSESSTSYSQVSAGNSHTLAIDTNSLLYAWGKTPANGDTVNRSSPVQIGANSWLNVSTGNDMSLATDITQTLYAWGLNTNYQLGSATFAINQSVTSPVAIGTLALRQGEASSGGAGNGGFIKNI